MDAEKVPSLRKALAIQKALQAASIVSGYKNVLLEHKVKRLVHFARAHEWFARDGNLTSLLMIHLMCINDDLRGFRLSHEVKMVDALSLKMDLPNREWIKSKVMGLYESNGDTSTTEKIFLKEEKKGIVLYNQMISLSAKYAPEKAQSLFAEMVKKGIPPTSVTFRGLLAALSLSAKHEAPTEVLRVLLSMRNVGVTPQFYHYEAVIDAFARIRTADYILSEVEIIKLVHVARNQQAFNAILSRCTLTLESAQDLEEMKMKIDAAQDLVDFLEEKKWSYAVPDITYWRLKDLKFKWPKRVKKTEETEE